MHMISSILIMLSFLSIITMAQQENNWNIKMRFLDSEVLPGEPIYIELDAVNKTNGALSYWWHYNPNFFELDGKQCKHLLGTNLPPGRHYETRKDASIKSKSQADLKEPGFSETKLVYINEL